VVILKILIIAPLPPPVTGQSLAVQVIVEALSDKKSIYVVNTSKQEFDQGLNSLARFLKVGSSLLQIVRNSRQASVIYLNVSQSVAGNLKDFLTYLICWRKLNKMVIHLHGGAGMRVLMSDKHPLLRALNTFFLKRVGAVVVLGDRLKDIYAGVVAPEKLHAVPNFANDEFFVAPEVIDAKFSNTQPLRLLFLSNLLPGKGHQELLSALAQLPVAQRSQFHLDFAGGYESQEDEVRFRQQVQAVDNLSVKVHGVVQGEHKRQLLKQAHLFCLPTYYPYEGQPISILEAYASGCAVMTTDHSGIFDTFTPGVNGLEVSPRKPGTIVQALEHALAEPHALRTFAKTNNQHAQEKYRASIHLEALEKIIFSVAK
jgi:glycosyltransferase involved in cell wall biosynthesis